MEKVKIVLRWIAVLPGAIIGAYIAYFAFRIIQTIGLWVRIPPDSFFYKAFIEGGSHYVMGVCFVYSGVFIAPSLHKHVTFILTGLGLLFAGMFLLSALEVRDYWSILYSFCLAFGLGTMLWHLQGQ